MCGTSAAPPPTNTRVFWKRKDREPWWLVNVIINNLKGIFFDDDDFEHMSCSIDASWGKIGMTEIRIFDHRDLKKCENFH